MSKVKAISLFILIMIANLSTSAIIAADSKIAATGKQSKPDECDFSRKSFTEFINRYQKKKSILVTEQASQLLYLIYCDAEHALKTQKLEVSESKTYLDNVRLIMDEYLSKSIEVREDGKVGKVAPFKGSLSERFSGEKAFLFPETSVISSLRIKTDHKNYCVSVNNGSCLYAELLTLMTGSTHLELFVNSKLKCSSSMIVLSGKENIFKC